MAQRENGDSTGDNRQSGRQLSESEIEQASASERKQKKRRGGEVGRAGEKEEDDRDCIRAPLKESIIKEKAVMI